MTLFGSLCDGCYGEGSYVVGYDPDRGEVTERCCLGPDFAYDPAALATLAHNLAVAGALCRAFALGWDGRIRYSIDGWDVWMPNVAGKAAP